MTFSMLLPVLLSAAVVAPDAAPACSAAAPVAAATQPADTLRALYRGGRPFADFLAGARSRRDQWHDHYGHATVPPAVLDQGRALGGPWRLLVVAEDWCGDSANTIPYLAKLVEQVEGIDMRVIDSRTGRFLMEAHRTPDGRPATPTVLLLDSDWRLAGCFVERPGPLMDWYQEHRADMSSEELHEYMYAWYDENRGAATMDEVIGLIEAARAGVPRCPGGTSSADPERAPR